MYGRENKVYYCEALGGELETGSRAEMECRREKGLKLRMERKKEGQGLGGGGLQK